MTSDKGTDGYMFCDSGVVVNRNLKSSTGRTAKLGENLKRGNNQRQATKRKERRQIVFFDMEEL